MRLSIVQELVIVGDPGESNVTAFTTQGMVSSMTRSGMPPPAENTAVETSTTPTGTTTTSNQPVIEPVIEPAVNISTIDDGQFVFGDKVAVIIEIDAYTVQNLFPIMLHFSTVLGPEWPVVLLTMRDKWHMPKSPPMLRALESGRIRVMFLPDDTDFYDHRAVSVFMTRPWLWETMSSAGRVLLFQPDSILCVNADVRADDFLEWDYLGAPILPGMGSGYNGGLSIRNPRIFLQIAMTHDFETETRGENAFEDQWFYHKIKDIPDVKLPDAEVAKWFSTETTFNPHSLGFHQPRRWLKKEQADEAQKWCPEIGMMINSRFVPS